MPNENVISDVSKTLAALLTAELNGVGSAAVHDLLSTPPSPSLTVTLLEVREDLETRNRPTVRTPLANGAVVKRPPMALALRYLLTPWAGDRITEQKMLGLALRRFYDEAIITGEDLSGVLAGSGDSLKLTLVPLTLYDRAQVWQALTKPFKLSIAYDVRVVNLDTAVQVTAAPVATGSFGPAPAAGGVP